MFASPTHQNHLKSGKYPGYWALKKLRRQLRASLGKRLASRGLATPAMPLPIAPSAVHRVIVCRYNKRMGNMLFLTPLLQSLAQRLPHAEIDLLIGDARYAPLFEGLPGIRHIWSLPTRSWSWPYKMLALLFRLRRRHYDLSIDPAMNSVSNRLAARLCHAGKQLGFATYDQWLALTHGIASPDECHEGLKPLHLVNTGLGGNSPLCSEIHLPLSHREREVGRQALHALHAWKPGQPILGFFTEATGKKRLPQAWWDEWLVTLRAARPDVQLLQILAPGQALPADTQMPTLCTTDLRRLGAILSHLNLFVACDSGPMHLAAAAGAPTLGLFHATDSRRYRPLTQSSHSLEIDQLTPSEVAQQVTRRLHRVTFNFPARRHPDNFRSADKMPGAPDPRNPVAVGIKTPGIPAATPPNYLAQ